MDLSLPPSSLQSALFHQSFVVPRQHMRFYLLNRIQSHTNDDQERGSPKVEGDIEPPVKDGWENTDRRNIKGSPQGDPGEDFVDIFSSLLAWAEAGNVAAKLFHIFCYIIRVEGHGRVEIAEEDDEPDIEKIV